LSLQHCFFSCVKNDSQEYYGIGELKSTNRFSEISRNKKWFLIIKTAILAASEQIKPE